MGTICVIVSYGDILFHKRNTLLKKVLDWPVGFFLFLRMKGDRKLSSKIQIFRNNNNAKQDLRISQNISLKNNKD